MGFGSEILFIVALAMLLLGPKQFPSILRHLSKAKAKLDNATRTFTSALQVELESVDHKRVQRTEGLEGNE